MRRVAAETIDRGMAGGKTELFAASAAHLVLPISLHLSTDNYILRLLFNEYAV